MILDILSTALAKKLVEVPLAPVLSSLQGLLLDGRALNFAKETLREKYTEAVLPSSYEHVVDNLQLTKEDFVEYFKATPTPTQSSLQKYLRARLLARSEGWINNRPAEMLLQSMVDDFLQAYQAYFVTTDPQLTTLNLTGLTQDALEVICEVRDAIKALSDAAARPSTEPRQGSDFGSEITTFLTVTNIPFEIVERDKSHADIVVIDPSSIFPTRFYLHATARPLSIDDLDQLLTRLRGHGRYSHVLVVAENVPFEVVSHGERRGVIFNSTAAFRQAFLKISTPERFIIGTLSARSLAETCNVHELYIHPDAVPVDPGDKLHQSWFSERVPVKQLIDAFLADQDQRILFVFGGYGSGKSSLCARLTLDLANEGSVSPVYVSLRQFRDAPDLVRIVTKADQLAKTLGGPQRRSVVILDGLDELPNALDITEKRNNLLGLLQASARSDKLIVTARTTYFRGMEDFWKLFARSNDHPLWSEIARFIPEGNLRPKVKAIVLREFSSAQIAEFLKGYAKWYGKDASYADEFLDRILNHDRMGAFRTLSRNPLYLFLLATSEPWKNPNVGCLSEVLGIFVTYWLERDIEKGKSRWGLSTTDRTEFSRSVALWMFENQTDSLDFARFDEIVRSFFDAPLTENELASLSLDLQTTGLFASVGGGISFMSRGFSDYFVADHLVHLKEDDAHPVILPTVSQIELMLGVAEYRRPYIQYRADDVLKRNGIAITDDLYRDIEIPTKDILFGKGARDRWINVNRDPHDKDRRGQPTMRLLVNASLQIAEKQAQQGIPVLVANAMGLHARASVWLIRTFQQWLATQEQEPAPEVFLIRGGRRVNIASIMGVMMIAAGPGTVVLVAYENSSIEAIEGLLRLLRCTPTNDESRLWVADWSATSGDRVLFDTVSVPQFSSWAWT